MENQYIQKFSAEIIAELWMKLSLEQLWKVLDALFEKKCRFSLKKTFGNNLEEALGEQKKPLFSKALLKFLPGICLKIFQRIPSKILPCPAKTFSKDFFRHFLIFFSGNSFKDSCWSFFKNYSQEFLQEFSQIFHPGFFQEIIRKILSKFLYGFLREFLLALLQKIFKDFL